MDSESSTYAQDIERIQVIIEKCNNKLTQTGIKIDQAIDRLKPSMNN